MTVADALASLTTDYERLLTAERQSNATAYIAGLVYGGLAGFMAGAVVVWIVTRAAG